MQSKSKIRLTPLRVFLSGAAIAFLALLPAILPYGGQFVTRGDYIEQQLPFLVEAGRILRQGLDVYSFNTFLGAPAMGSYAFYTLGSPFVWPLALLPKAILPYGITVMVVLKHALTMLSAYMYLDHMVKHNEKAYLGAILYTFSSFTVINTQFYHFTEVIAFFPLLLLGLELAMSNTPKPGLLALFCFLNTLTNYYFMFGSALLCVIYSLFRFFCADWNIPNRIHRFILAVFECALGCAMAGFLLCPAMLFMLQITRTGGVVNLFEGYSIGNILERIRVLLMPIESSVVHAYYGDAASWSSTAAWLPLLGFTGTALFLFQRDSRQRWLQGLLILLIGVSFVPALCGLFVLESNRDYTRWWYGLVLMEVLATLLVLDDEKPVPSEQRKLLSRTFFFCSGIVLILTVPFLLSPDFFENIFGHAVGSFFRNRQEGARSSETFLYFSLGITLASGACMLFCLWQNVSYRTMIALAVLISISAYAGYIQTGDTHINSGGELPGEGKYQLSEIAQPTLSALSLPDEDGYLRIDYGNKLRNYGLLRGASSTRVFHSLRSSYVGRFLQTAGFGYNESTTVGPSNGDGAIRAFLSVSEYHQTDSEDSIPEGFIYDREENGFPVYINPNAVPIGFLQTVCTGTYDQPMDWESLGPTLLSAVTLDEPYLSQAKERLDLLDVHHIQDWQENVDRLKGQACDSFETDAHGFTAHIVTEQYGYLVFTIPYDKGFKATVDGEKQKIIPCDIAFMSIELEPGDHMIHFEYHTRGLKAGIALSLFAALTLLVYLYVLHQLRKKEPANIR